MNVTMDNLLFYILLAFLVYTFFFEKKSEGFKKISKAFKKDPNIIKLSNVTPEVT